MGSRLPPPLQEGAIATLKGYPDISNLCQIGLISFLSTMSPLHLFPLVMMAVAIPQRNAPRQREFDGHEFVELLPGDFTRDEYETLLQEFQSFLLRQELISRGDFVDVDNLECTPKIGKYTVEDPVQCDKFYVCETDRTLVPKLCEDGLVYDVPGKSCNHPQRVECKDRTELQEPSPSAGCPRKNGYFHPEEPEKCNEYTTCVDGNPTPGKCSTGVVWSPTILACTTTRLRFGNHDRLPHPTDCGKFYVCFENGTF